VLSVITLLADGDAEFYLRARGPLLRPAGESKTGISPRTPFIVSRTCKPKPAGHARGVFFRNPRARAPFRLLPIRAPRQAVLRTSSWLAPSRITNRPCDLPVEKTRDASNRCLPPKRTVCTRTSRVPGSLSQLSLRGRPRSLRLRAVLPGDRTFHDVRRPLRRTVIEHVISSSIASRPGETSVGVFFPRCRCDRASDIPVAIPAFTLAPHPPSRVLQCGRTSFF